MAMAGTYDIVIRGGTVTTALARLLVLSTSAYVEFGSWRWARSPGAG